MIFESWKGNVAGSESFGDNAKGSAFGRLKEW